MAAVNFNRQALTSKAGDQGDHNTVAQFNCEIAGQLVGSIDTIEGLSSVHDVIEYRDADADGKQMMARPGKRKAKTIKLFRAYGNTREFIDWFEKTRTGNVLRTTVTITQTNAADEALGQIHIRDAWPCAYGIDGFSSKSSALLREWIEISAEAVDYA